MNAVVESTAIEPAQTRAVATQPMNPMQMLAHAVQQGVPVETLRELRQLQKEWEADEARRQFNEAFAAFKAEAIVIVKNTTIKEGPLKGKKHANLFDVVDAVTPKLSAHGLTIAWKLTKDEKDWLEVTCTLRHSAGHFETVSMGSGPDSGPGRNAIQARCSAKTYLERYTATAILGLAAQDADDDGNKAGGGGPELITDKQAADLNAKISEVGANKAQFLKFLKVEKLSDLEAKRYTAALQALEDKARGNR
jgi:hypothetical protein